MKRFLDEKGCYHILFENLSSFFEYTDPSKIPSDMHKENEEKRKDVVGDEDRGWRYGDEKTRASYLATRFDKKKGKGLCAEAVKEVTTSRDYKKLLQQAMSYRKRVSFEEFGSRIDVTKAISGEDKYFAAYKNKNRPTVKIAINICGSGCVGQDEFIKLAKTAIPTIFALETAGICTEVYFVAFSTGTFKDPEHKHDQTAVKIKSAQERFNWTTFAPVFTLGSYRESMFLSWIYAPHRVTSGLGCPMKDSTIKENGNFGYDVVIGFNNPGPVKQVTEVFSQLKLKK